MSQLNNNDLDPAFSEDTKLPAKRQFYAVRKCDSLRAPAIFLHWDDCCFYVDSKENVGPLDYQSFDSMDDAARYVVLPTITLESMKRSADKASLLSPGTKKRRKLPAKQKPTTNTPSDGDASGKTSRASRKKGRGGGLDEETDRAILQLMFSPERHQAFTTYADKHESIFGDWGSKKRLQVKNRRNYLILLKKQSFEKFLELCKARGVSSIQQTPTTNTPSETNNATPLPAGASVFKASRKRGVAVDEETDRAILQLMFSPERHLPFKTYADNHKLIFGDWGSKKRLQVRNRRNYLIRLKKKSPEQILELCEARGVNPVQQKPTTNTSSSETNATPPELLPQTGDASRESDSLVPGGASISPDISPETNAAPQELPPQSGELSNPVPRGASASRASRKKDGVDEETDRAILQLMFSPERHRPFSTYADNHESIFGDWGSKKRLQVRNRRNYLIRLKKQSFEKFLELCKARGVNPIQQKLTWNTPSETNVTPPELPPQSGDASSESNTLVPRGASASRASRKKDGVDEETDRAILQLMFSPERHLPFKTYTDNHKSIFGDRGSKKRLQERNRRNYLIRLKKTSPEKFLELCKARGVNPIQQKSTTNTPSETFESSNPVPGGTSASKATRKRGVAVDEETDRAILQLMFSPERHHTFKTYADNHASIFGDSESKKRSQVINRRNYLIALEKRSPDQILELCEARGVNPIQQKPTTKTSSSETNATPPELLPQTGDASRESDSLVPGGASIPSETNSTSPELPPQSGELSNPVPTGGASASRTSRKKDVVDETGSTATHEEETD
jgi:hypothetical protein